MNILQVVQGYSPAIGGTERVVQRVSEKLVERHGDCISVYTTTAYNCELFWRADQPQLPAGVEVINGVVVRRFPVYNGFGQLRQLLAKGSYAWHLPYSDWLRTWHNGPIVPGMAREIARANADVVAASSFPLLHMHYALQGSRRRGLPIVFHGGIHTADAYGFERPIIYEAIRQSDAYIAYSEFERDFLTARGIDPAKITVIGAGVDPECYADADDRAIRARFGWGDAPIVAFVGQQVPHKGLDMLLEAMQHVWADQPHVCLLIAGARTTYSQVVETWLSRLPPQQRGRVAVINNFAEDQKPFIFAACNMLVFPSGFESFGIVLVEAWAARKPVIATRVGAVQSVVSEGKDGILIRHRDVNELVAAIRTLLNNPELARQMGEAGYKKVLNKYTWNIVADRFREVYQYANQLKNRN